MAAMAFVELSSGPQLKDAPKATKAFKILDPKLLIN